MSRALEHAFRPQAAAQLDWKRCRLLGWHLFIRIVADGAKAVRFGRKTN
jgi:hypothetical protein